MKNHRIKAPAKGKEKLSNQMWGGHYATAPAEIMQQINASIGVDKVLYAQDIQGSLAHVAMLAKQGIVTKKEADAITSGLKNIRSEIESGGFHFTPELEDIHMHIEARLKELIGPTAGKLHTARSRNDQVAVTFKLWVRDAIDALDQGLQELQKALITRAEEYQDALMPGFTHLQVAQPVTLGHHLLSFVEMLGRDRSRLKDARVRLNESPLGAAALAGTSFPLDREMTAKALGFDRPTANSLDSVSDRDFAIEYLFCVSMVAMHLSRLAEELVIWTSAQFRFISLSEKFTTGSSIMPQKRNPDAAELVRAKTGRVFGHLIGLLTVMKGLALTYSKDMQEDKEPVIDAASTIQLCVAATIGMIKDFKANKEIMEEAASSGYSTATDLADWLVQNLNLPFRECHHITGKIVVLAEKQNIRLDEVSLTDMQTIEPRITKAIFDVLKPLAAAASRKSFGGTSPTNVRKAIIEAKKRFSL